LQLQWLPGVPLNNTAGYIARTPTLLLHSDEKESEMMDASSPRQGSAWRTAAINAVVLFCRLGAAELAARLYNA
jgi:hypothetical protein